MRSFSLDIPAWVATSAAPWRQSWVIFAKNPLTAISVLLLRQGKEQRRNQSEIVSQTIGACKSQSDTSGKSRSLRYKVRAKVPPSTSNVLPVI